MMDPGRVEKMTSVVNPCTVRSFDPIIIYEKSVRQGEENL